MRRKGFLIIGLLIAAGFMVAAQTTPTTSAQDGGTIVIVAEMNTNAYVNTSVSLEPNTEYTIEFVNPSSTGHNLRIDVDHDLAEDTLADGDDKVIGFDNTKAEQEGMNNSWTGSWTTPDEDVTVPFYCGVTGHWAAGMEGEFIVGEGGEPSPAFGLYLAFTTMIVAAVAVAKIRR